VVIVDVRQAPKAVTEGCDAVHGLAIDC
jgi:hypothetical protein